MPKKSKKSKSKRVSLKDKHKVIKKVKEHHRKQRKEARKAGAGKKKPSLLKDPGVPANFPYRDQVVKELKFEHDRIQAAEAAKREARKARRAARKVRRCRAPGAACSGHRHIIAVYLGVLPLAAVTRDGLLLGCGACSGLYLSVPTDAAHA